METPRPEADFLPVADVEIDSVEPQRSGFVLRGTGADSAEYRMDLHLELPVDQRTKAVLGELLSQSEWRIWRRARQPIKAPRLGRSPSKTPRPPGAP